ncbi:MAG: O-methyltransferase [Candidatus Eiseniibacteriota bacterium]|nr:MAG: O-methyltransferase [Candidatus Eisenbacteria bacterium]
MAEKLMSERLREYLNGLVPPRPPEMKVMEAHARETDFPIIGPACGYLCYQIARMIRAKRIFELGSGFGYSTAWFARAVKENGGGEVHHVVWDEGLSRQARNHLRKMGLEDVVRYHVSEAIWKLRETPGPFDLIFNDIDKTGYPESLAVIREKLKTGGVLIMDNMLWSGRVFDDKDRDPETEAIRESTRLMVEDPAWLTTVIPIRDGLMVAYKS